MREKSWNKYSESSAKEINYISIEGKKKTKQEKKVIGLRAYHFWKTFSQASTTLKKLKLENSLLSSKNSHHAFNLVCISIGVL